MVDSTVNFPILTFFVPGIMGSSLLLTRKTKYGTKEKIGIWGKDFQSNVRLFHENPDYLMPLNPEDIQADEVIPYFENIRLPQSILRPISIPLKVTVYQDLIDFCTKPEGLGLSLNETFFPFAYNWLADNRITADKLAKDVLDKMRQDPNSSFCFIAHSMGGIIVRLMLLNYPKIAEKTKLFFQIASPLKGSAKAYHSIKRYPTLHPLFDRGWQLFQQGENRGDLAKALERCYALYQLLPSPEIITLYDESGQGYSALNPDIWHEDLHDYVNAAIEVHEKIQQSKELSVNLKCVYSAQDQTPIHYVIDPSNFRIKREIPSPIMGDGTVTVVSAIAYSREKQRTITTDKPCDHMGICQNPTVYNLLKQEWSLL